MITIKDIARLCNVSVTTVNRALSGKPDVNPETKKLIVETSALHGYRPDLLARRLAKGSSQVIGILAFDLENPFFNQFVSHFQRFAKALGYGIHTALIENRSEDEPHALIELASLRVAGIVYVPLNEGEDYEALVSSLGVPVVCLINRLSSKFDFVGTNEAEVMAELVHEILDRGYRRILFFSPRPLAEEGLNRYSLLERERGVVDVLREDPRVESWEVIDKEIDWTPVAGRIREQPGTTAVVCFNDFRALSVMRSLRDHALEPGRDYGLTGFDQLAIAQYFRPLLTSIEFPVAAMAESALDFLFQAMEPENRGGGRELIVPSRIVQGDTLQSRGWLPK